MDDLIWAALLLIPTMFIVGVIQYTAAHLMILGLMAGGVWMAMIGTLWFVERYMEESEAQEQDGW